MRNYSILFRRYPVGKSKKGRRDSDLQDFSTTKARDLFVPGLKKSPIVTATYQVWSWNLERRSDSQMLITSCRRSTAIDGHGTLSSCIHTYQRSRKKGFLQNWGCSRPFGSAWSTRPRNPNCLWITPLVSTFSRERIHIPPNSAVHLPITTNTEKSVTITATTEITGHPSTMARVRGAKCSRSTSSSSRANFTNYG